MRRGSHRGPAAARSPGSRTRTATRSRSRGIAERRRGDPAPVRANARQAASRPALARHRKRELSAREILHAMWEENVETVRRVYEGVNARLEAPRELFAPDYEFDNTELWPDVADVLGFDAAQEAMREYWETFEGYRVEIEEVIYADD